MLWIMTVVSGHLFRAMGVNRRHEKASRFCVTFINSFSSLDRRATFKEYL